MLRRFILITTIAGVAASVDIAAKSIWMTPTPLLHQRSMMWLITSSALLPACLAAVFTPSRLANAAAALCAGGLVGNLTSALSNHGHAVPNPFLLGGLDHGIAFNLADVFFIVGIVGTVGIAAVAVRARVAVPGLPTPPDPL
jgi:lipoprotein signal peptidase